MGMRTRLIAPIFTLMLLAFGAFGFTLNSSAQEAATPSPAATMELRPSHIHFGTCPDFGEVKAPLNDLSGVPGDIRGQSSAIQAEYSMTNIPMVLDDLLADNYAINVHQSAEAMDISIACGDIGGSVDENGSLVIGLRELNNSGYTGIAVLTINAADPATTDVAVYVARDSGKSS